MPYVKTAEVWVPGLEQFIFSFIVPAGGDRWTFCVSRKVLEELRGGDVDDPQAVLDQFRSRIYLAAQGRMDWGDPMRQQRLDADEIKEAAKKP